MNDNRLSEILQSLPRERAGGDFTARVRSRIEKRPTLLGAAWSRPALAAAMALIALTLGFGWREWRHAKAQTATVARLELLLEEKQALEAELVSLRRLASDARPVVYLGGNEQVDLVLDLERLRNRQTARSGPHTPNAFSPADLRAQPGGTRTAVY